MGTGQRLSLIGFGFGFGGGVLFAIISSCNVTYIIYKYINAMSL